MFYLKKEMTQYCWESCHPIASPLKDFGKLRVFALRMARLETYDFYQITQLCATLLQLYINCTVKDFPVHYGGKCRGPYKLRQL